MVCNRCKMVVKSELEKLGLHPIDIELGEVEIKEENIEIHDMGVVLFKNVLPMQNHDYILEFARSLRLKALEDDLLKLNKEFNYCSSSMIEMYH